MKLSEHFHKEAGNDFWGFVNHTPTCKVIHTFSDQDDYYARNRIGKTRVGEYSSILLNTKMRVCFYNIEEETFD